MKKDELLEKLRNSNRNENDFCNIVTENGIDYIFHHISEEAFVSGYIIAKVDEGFLVIPYTDILVKNGHKQLDPDNAKLLDLAYISELISEIENDYKNKIEFFNKGIFEISFDNMSL